jgi:hypothetical protein
MVEMTLALFEPHLHAWECLDLLGRLTQLLYQVYQYVKTTKSSSRCFLNFLLLDIIRENLNEENRSQILADVVRIAYQLHVLKFMPDRIPVGNSQ